MRRRGAPAPPAVAAFCLLLTGVAAAERPPRTLVVVLDAVPFQAVADLVAAESVFEGFQPPVPIISTFPSSTSVAMVGLLEPLGLARSPGYEARFFDWERRKVRGGGVFSFFRIEFAWRDFFDWSRKGVVRTALGGIRPVKTSRGRIEDAVEAFFRSDRDPYFAYIETTDLVAHLEGPSALAPVLRRLDTALRLARGARPDHRFRTVIFSDHGIAGDGSPLVNVHPAVEAAIESSELRLRKKLRRPDDVVLTPYGLLSSFEVYTRPERVAGLARVLGGTVDGVDFCVHRSRGGFTVVGAGGRARIARMEDGSGAALWSYLPENGDPLDYGPVAAALVRAGGLAAGGEAAGAVADGRWFAATAGHRYPDAFHRIARAFDLVDNEASLLCSLEPGHMYGLELTERLADVSGPAVRWTHGALFREATLGFLLTDDERFAPAVALRFDEALRPLNEPRPPSLTSSPRPGW